MKHKFERDVQYNIFSIELFWRELSYLVSYDEKATMKGSNASLLNVLVELKRI
jgi:hypothetical protein